MYTKKYRSIIKEDLELIINQNINFSKFKNKSFLITGALGMLASYYMYTLMYLNDKFNYNIKIYTLVRNKEKLKRLIDINRKDIFVLEQDVCEKIIIDGKLDYIIHMAGYSNPKNIIKDPVGIINANVIGTLNVLKLAKEKQAKIIFTSTREVYGKIDKNIINENDSGILDCTELRSCYPESKRMAENLIISYAYQHGIKYQIARIAHCYGPRMTIKEDGRIMSDLINHVVSETDIILKSNGEAKRSFCYISDAITALFIITLSSKENEIFNLANETEEIAIKDLAYFLTKWYKKTNINVLFKIEDNNNQYVKFKRVKLNTFKLEQLGWKPIISLKDGIYRTVEYFKSENNQ